TGREHFGGISDFASGVREPLGELAVCVGYRRQDQSADQEPKHRTYCAAALEPVVDHQHPANADHRPESKRKIFARPERPAQSGCNRGRLCGHSIPPSIDRSADLLVVSFDRSCDLFSVSIDPSPISLSSRSIARSIASFLDCSSLSVAPFDRALPLGAFPLKRRLSIFKRRLSIFDAVEDFK